MLEWAVADRLDPSTLKDLPDLWRSESSPNPFSSPSFLRVMSEHAAGARATPTLALARSDEGRLMAVWPLLLGRNGMLTFLQRDYSDQRTCITRPEVSAGELAAGLAQLVKVASPAGVRLANIPSWGPTLAASCEALRQVGWRYRAFPAWACPVLRVEPGPGAGASLRQEPDRHTRVRGYASRLAREYGFAFEVEEDATHLDRWCEEFCDAHEYRWNGTPSPSPYRLPEARSLFRQVVAAWACDGVLIRFAIRVASGRAAFVVALRANRRLIYHHV